LRVLLVDDIESIRSMLRTLLELETGFEIVGEASNGKEAIQAAAELDPELIVMDLHMPEMNGLEATQAISSTMPHIQIVAFTSSDTPGVARSLEEAGAIAHLAKGETAGLMAVLKGLRDSSSVRP
jgi:DNA-binding NarL/FixJ family response regulator